MSEHENEHCCCEEHEHDEHDEHCCKEHEHDEHCHHDHHHEHHHEGGVDIHVHEGAVAASFEKKLSLSQAEIIDKLKPMMKQLKDEMKEHGGIIGHIKASISGAETTTMLSLTKDIIDEKSEATGICTLCFAAIIFNINEEILKEEVEEIYDAL